MGRRLSRSHQEQDIEFVAKQRRLQLMGLVLYFSKQNPSLNAEYMGYTQAQLDAELQNCLSEVNLQASIALLSALEAIFRIDFAVRCEQRYKDNLSVHFRSIFKKKRYQVHFEDDIIAGWQAHTVGANPLLNELRQANKFRHWLAHGRYWIIKADVNRFTFDYIYHLAQSSEASLGFNLH